MCRWRIPTWSWLNGDPDECTALTVSENVSPASECPLAPHEFLRVFVRNGQDVFRYPEGRYGNGELRYINEVPVLIVRGSRREIGEQIGNLALKPAARVVDLARAYPLKSIALSELFDRTRGSP